MTIFRIIVAVYIALGALATILIVGKERKPITGGTAAIVTVLSAMVISALLL